MDSTTISLGERIGFSDRLKVTLRDRNLSGRPSAFARSFNERAEGCAVTAHAARKWLVGKAIPTQERIVVIAKWLNVNASWLRFGDAENTAFLAARGLENVLLTKEQSDLVQGIFALSKPAQSVVRDLVESLRTLEGGIAVQKHPSARQDLT